MAYLRAAGLVLALAAFYALALVLAPFAKTRPRLRAMVARPFHRNVCRFLRLRVTLRGGPLGDGAHLVVANHSSWSDILAVGCVLPVTFVARHDMAGWPLFGYLARFQNTIFVDRKRLRALPGVNAEIAGRLAARSNVVLFAEATTGDGTRLLPFHSPHFQSIVDLPGDAPALVQPAAINYARRNGLPLGKAERASIAWYGDMTLAPHLWALLKGGPIQCEVTLGEPIRVEPGANRKALAAQARHAVRALIHPARLGTEGETAKLAYSHPGQKALHVEGAAAAPASPAQNVIQDG